MNCRSKRRRARGGWFGRGWGADFPDATAYGRSGALGERANFKADGSNRCLSLVFVVGGGTFLGRVLPLFHGGFKPANTVSDSFAEFGKLFRPEHEQSNPKNHQ